MTKTLDTDVTNPLMPTTVDTTEGDAPADPGTSTTTSTPDRAPDMPTDMPTDTDPGMLADYFVERAEPKGSPTDVVWTMVASGRVQLDAAGPAALEDFVDRMAGTARASLVDGRPVRVSATIRASGYTAYAEVAPRAWDIAFARTVHRKQEVGQGPDTMRKRRRTRRLSL